MPNTVCGNTGGERIFSRNDLFCELETAGSIFWRCDSIPTKRGQEAAGNFFAKIFVRASDVDVIIFGSAIGNLEDSGRRVWNCIRDLSSGFGKIFKFTGDLLLGLFGI